MLLSSFKVLDFQRSGFWSRTKGLASRCCTRLGFRHSMTTYSELRPTQHRLCSLWTRQTRHQVSTGFFFHTVLMCLYFLICYSSSGAGRLVKIFSPCGTVYNLFQAETIAFKEKIASSNMLPFQNPQVWFGLGSSLLKCRKH